MLWRTEQIRCPCAWISPEFYINNLTCLGPEVVPPQGPWGAPSDSLEVGFSSPPLFWAFLLSLSCLCLLHPSWRLLVGWIFPPAQNRLLVSQEFSPFALNQLCEFCWERKHAWSVEEGGPWFLLILWNWLRWLFLALHKRPCEFEGEVSHPLESLDLVHVISLDFFNVTIDNEYIH